MKEFKIIFITSIIYLVVLVGSLFIQYYYLNSKFNAILNLKDKIISKIENSKVKSSVIYKTYKIYNNEKNKKDNKITVGYVDKSVENNNKNIKEPSGNVIKCPHSVIIENDYVKCIDPDLNQQGDEQIVVKQKKFTEDIINPIIKTKDKKIKFIIGYDLVNKQLTGGILTFNILHIGIGSNLKDISLIAGVGKEIFKQITIMGGINYMAYPYTNKLNFSVAVGYRF